MSGKRIPWLVLPAALLFVMSVAAIVPLAVLLSHATESVAAKTGDAVGGLLNATLGRPAPQPEHSPAD
ncbi:MAG: hypothetical protein U0636_06655 [Phycisphaerales bacterium]